MFIGSNRNNLMEFSVMWINKQAYTNLLVAVSGKITVG
jgi:hypothetical protein